MKDKHFLSHQIMDVDRMMSKTALGHAHDFHPVIRTLYDHAEVSSESLAMSIGMVVIYDHQWQ